MNKLALIVFGWVVLGMNVQAASFDCGKAQSKVEHLICDNAEISKLDEELAASYKAALQDKAQAEAAKQAQKQWLKVRNDCESVVCVKTAYVSRLKTLAAITTHKEEASARIIDNQHVRYLIKGKGKNQPFCEAILATLNKRILSVDSLPCISEAVLKLPGVKDPAWEKLDLSQHEELVKKIQTLSTVGVQEYFREKKLNQKMYPTPEQQQRGFENAKNGGAELFMMRLSPEFFGDRVLVTLRDASRFCGRPPVIDGEMSSAAWVKPDLKEIATGPGLFDSYAGRPLMYHGQLYLMRAFGSGVGVELYVPRREYISMICDISYSINSGSKGETK